MAKTVLGIDIGSDRVKLALCKGGQIKKIAVETIPENIVKGGQVVSIETMSEVIRDVCKKNGISASQASVVLSSDRIFTRNVTMPLMNHDQLLYNLPFEFRDYLDDDMKNYVYDYAMISSIEEIEAAMEKSKEEEAKEADEDTNKKGAFSVETEYGSTGLSMELTAVVAPRDLLDDTQLMIKKAGMKLYKAAPPVSSFAAIIRHYEKAKELTGKGNEYCILDLGYTNIRMYMYKGDAINVSKILEIGLSGLDQTIADMYGVDVHLAHTYMMTNHNNCCESEACLNAYNSIAGELMRAMNFYRFSNPDSQLNDIWMCGGGSILDPLRKVIGELLDMNIHPATELLEDTKIDIDDNRALLAIGAALE